MSAFLSKVYGEGKESSFYGEWVQYHPVWGDVIQEESHVACDGLESRYKNDDSVLFLIEKYWWNIYI